MKKRPVLVWVLLVVFSIMLLFNVAGLVVEILFGLGILQTDLARVRGLHPISTVLSIAYVVSGVFFAVYLFRLKHKAFLWWHIFMGVGAVIVSYKLIEPTYLSVLIPYYFVIAFALVALVWCGVFYYLKRLNTSSHLT